MQNSLMNYFNISDSLAQKAANVEKKIFDTYLKVDEIAYKNQRKVLAAFNKHKVAQMHLGSTTGYGYDDVGRDTLEKIYADVFGGQDAIVRHTIVSGTHALAIGLFGILRPNDIMLSVTGKPYDTLDDVIGISENNNNYGSLRNYGVHYKGIDLKGGKVDFDAIKDYVENNKVKIVFVQRSKGYMDRPSLTVSEIGEVVKFVKNIDKDISVVVDNCYGEFAEEIEPCDVGADLIIGSLIKNAGGGIAQTGGYLVGRSDLIELCSYRLTSPGIGKEVGASLGQNRFLYQGLFMAPHITAQAMKTAIFAAGLYEDYGFSVNPTSSDFRTDIIQAIKFRDKDKLVAFCQGIQKGAPIDSYVTPEPWDMPGYDNEVIMAAGAFVEGASIELSADAPIKEPFIAFMQGGLTYESGKLGILIATQNMIDKGFIN